MSQLDSYTDRFPVAPPISYVSGIAPAPIYPNPFYERLQSLTTRPSFDTALSYGYNNSVVQENAFPELTKDPVSFFTEDETDFLSEIKYMGKTAEVNEDTIKNIDTYHELLLEYNKMQRFRNLDINQLKSKIIKALSHAKVVRDIMNSVNACQSRNCDPRMLNFQVSLPDYDPPLHGKMHYDADVDKSEHFIQMIVPFTDYFHSTVIHNTTHRIPYRPVDSYLHSTMRQDEISSKIIGKMNLHEDFSRTPVLPAGSLHVFTSMAYHSVNPNRHPGSAYTIYRMHLSDTPTLEELARIADNIKSVAHGRHYYFET